MKAKDATYDEEMKRKVVMTITADETDAGGLKVKFDFFPNVGGVSTHLGLNQAVIALMELVNNKFETPGKAVKKWSPRRGKVCWI
jgi:hypothetical protein